MEAFRALFPVFDANLIELSIIATKIRMLQCTIKRFLTVRLMRKCSNFVLYALLHWG